MITPAIRRPGKLNFKARRVINIYQVQFYLFALRINIYSIVVIYIKKLSMDFAMPDRCGAIELSKIQ
ncbi:hypothetical protein D9M71_647490 [compost metagenome]